MTGERYDTIIVGGGPAGLTAGIYTAREQLRTLLLEKAICGGWPLLTATIENYPGFPEGISGAELAARFKAQAERFGVEIREREEAVALDLSGGKIGVETARGSWRGRSLILAPGCRMKKLGLPGEEELAGRGVSYCAVCDGPLYRGREVAVIGGGNVALEEALFLTRFAARVHLIHRRDRFRGEKLVAAELEKTGKARFLLKSVPVAIGGKDGVESITVRRTETGKEETVPVEAVFVFVGVEPNTGFIRETVRLNGDGFIVTDPAGKTSADGVFAAGDAREGNVRQIAAACGEGVAAAMAVRKLLVEY